MLDFLTRLLGGSTNPSVAPSSQAQPPSQSPAAPSNAMYPNNPNLPSVNNDWLKRYADAQAALAGARTFHQRGLLNVLTGRDEDAARQAAMTTSGPEEYYKQLGSVPQYQSAVNTSNAGVMDNQQTLTFLHNLGFPTPAGLIGMGGDAPVQQAPASSAPQSAPQAPSAPISAASTRPPVSNAPAQSPEFGTSNGVDLDSLFTRLSQPLPSLPALTSPAPNTSPAAPAMPPAGPNAPAQNANAGGDNPFAAIAPQLNIFNRAAAGMPKFMPTVLEGIKAGQLGIDPKLNMYRDSQGNMRDSVSNQIVPDADASARLARIAGDTAEAQQIPERVTNTQRISQEEAAKIAEQQNQGGIQGGLQQQSSDLALRNLQAGKTIDSQNAELKTLNDQANSADSGLQLGQQIVNAANGIYTGKGAGVVQDFRKLAQGAATLAGVQLPASFNENTSKFEQLKFAAQQLVAVASHSLSPRVSQLIYQQIANVKPGDATSVKGLRDIITTQIFPTLLRQRAMLGATADYYQKNPTKLDAASAVPTQLPIASFGVKSDLHKVQPGDYYIDPKTGDLDQR